MRNISVSLALTLFLIAMAMPSHAADKQSSAQAGQAGKIWTNDDLDQLRARGLISIVGPFPEPAPEAPEPATPPPAVAPQATPYVRTQDPDWYADQAALLQAQLDETQAALRQAQDSLAQAASLPQTQGGINLAQASVGVTPEAGIAILEARLSEIQSQLDDLADLARQNYIPPGVLRG
jgi:hypothetical protein